LRKRVSKAQGVENEPLETSSSSSLSKISGSSESPTQEVETSLPPDVMQVTYVRRTVLTASRRSARRLACRWSGGLDGPACGIWQWPRCQWWKWRCQSLACRQSTSKSGQVQSCRNAESNLVFNPLPAVQSVLLQEWLVGLLLRPWGGRRCSGFPDNCASSLPETERYVTFWLAIAACKRTCTACFPRLWPLTTEHVGDFVSPAFDYRGISWAKKCIRGSVIGASSGCLKFHLFWGCIPNVLHAPPPPPRMPRTWGVREETRKGMAMTAIHGRS